MKKSILISILFLAFGIINLNAQDKNAATKDAEVTLSVKMSCNNCAEKVKKQLAFTKGVKEVIPDLEKQVVVVKYRNDKTSSDNLIASLSEIGYSAKVAASGCPKQKSGVCCPNAHKGCAGTVSSEKKIAPNSKSEK